MSAQALPTARQRAMCYQGNHLQRIAVFRMPPHQLNGCVLNRPDTLCQRGVTARGLQARNSITAHFPAADGGRDSRIWSGGNVRTLQVIKGDSKTTGSGQRIISAHHTGTGFIWGFAFGANYKCLKTVTADIWCRSTKESAWRSVFNSCSQ